MGCFCGTVAAQERFVMISDKARRWAEAVFKKEERDRDGQAAMTEYEVQARRQPMSLYRVRLVPPV
jgi:hypothetical protein